MRLDDTLDTDVLEQHFRRKNRQWLMITSAFLVLGVLFAIFFNDKSGKDLLSWQNETFAVSLPDGSSYCAPFRTIERITLVEAPDFGSCVSGEAEKTLKYGIWENETLGSYVLCAYRCYDVVIQVQTGDQVFWISYESEETTRLLYDNFLREVAEAKAVSGQ